jgi:CheY-like chemotaxis protein
MLVEDLISRRPDIRLLSAREGLEGLRLAQTVIPDMILMDINLPGMSGFEALEKLKRQPETQNIPVIALSAAAMSKDIQKGIQAGFFAYLTKPFVIDDLLNTIDQALAARQSGPPPDDLAGEPYPGTLAPALGGRPHS